MKKIISVILVSLLLFTATVSCADSKPTLLEFIDQSADGYDFDGMEWVFGRVDSYFMDSDTVLGYVGNTGFADSALKRIESIEEKYDIVYKESLVNNIGEVVMLEASSGKSSFDAIQHESYSLVEGIRAGLYTDLNEVSNFIDFRDSEKWGSPYLLEELCYDGGIYGVVPSAVPMLSYSSACNIVVANLDYILGLGMPDPRTYYENDEWTWETFKGLLPQYAMENSVENKYSLLCNPSWMFRCFIASNCGRSIVRDEEGNFIPAPATEPGRVALEEAWELCYGEPSEYIDLESAPKDYEVVFDSGNYAMSVMDSYQIYSSTSSVTYTMENFTLLPFPTGPNLPVGTVTSSASSVDYATCIPGTLNDPWVSALILDEIYAPFEGYETKESIMAYMNENYFGDEFNTNIFFEVISKAIPDFDGFFYKQYAYDILDGRTVASFLDANLAQAQRVIDEEIATALVTAEELFGVH